MAKLPPPFNRVYEYTNRSMLQFANALCPYLKRIGCAGGVPGGSYDNYVEVPISSNDILNLHTTPKPLLPPPGPGKYYDFKFYIEWTKGSAIYGGGTFIDVYAPSFGGIVARWDTKTLFDNLLVPAGATSIVSGTSTSLVETVGNSYYPTYTYSVLDSEPIVLFADSAVTGGDGTALAKIWYNLITIG